MNPDRKKQLRNAYREKPVTGGVCCIKCSGNQRLRIQATTNVEGLRNRYNFAISMGTCPDPTLSGECDKYGAGSFTFTVLEEITKGETQSDKDFSEDVQALYELWMEKIEKEGLE